MSAEEDAKALEKVLGLYHWFRLHPGVPCLSPSEGIRLIKIWDAITAAAPEVDDAKIREQLFTYINAIWEVVIIAAIQQRSLLASLAEEIEEE